MTDPTTPVDLDRLDALHRAAVNRGRPSTAIHENYPALSAELRALRTAMEQRRQVDDIVRCSSPECGDVLCGAYALRDRAAENAALRAENERLTASRSGTEAELLTALQRAAALETENERLRAWKSSMESIKTGFCLDCSQMWASTGEHICPRHNAIDAAAGGA